MKVNVKLINAFVDNGVGGNPAGLVLDADDLTTGQKQEIAGQVGRSETAFLSKSELADFRLEFFTPTRQIAHCGHATVATFGFLRQTGSVTTDHSSKETIDGIRHILFRGDRAYMEQTAPSFTAVDDALPEILRSLGIDETALAAGRKPLIVHTGNGFLVVPVRDIPTLRSLRPNQDLVKAISERFDLIGYYPFALDSVVPGRDATARMFAPAYGIPEESATGMAAGPLAAYLYHELGIQKTSFAIEQGHFMDPPSPSLIHVDVTVDNGTVTGLIAGGEAKVMDELTVTIS